MNFQFDHINYLQDLSHKTVPSSTSHQAVITSCTVSLKDEEPNKMCPYSNNDVLTGFYSLISIILNVMVSSLLPPPPTPKYTFIHSSLLMTFLPWIRHTNLPWCYSRPLITLDLPGMWRQVWQALSVRRWSLRSWRGRWYVLLQSPPPHQRL